MNIQSINRKGNRYAICIMKTIFSRLNTEGYNGFKTEYLSFKAFTILLANDINYYNNI